MAQKSIKVSIKNDRIRALEDRMDRVEGFFAQRLDKFEATLNGIRDNELEHIYGEMQKLSEFQAEIKGSVKMLKWIIGIVLGLLPALVKIVDLVLK